MSKAKVVGENYKWVVLIVAWYAFFSSMFPRFSLPPVIPDLIAIFRITNAEAGFLMTSTWLGYVLSQFPAGIVSDRLGARKTIGLMGIAMAIMTFVTGLANTYGELLIVRFLSGLSLGFMFAPAQGAILRWFPSGERAIATSLLITSPYVGSSISLIVSGSIAEFFGSWRYAFLIVAIVPALTPILSVLLREKEGKKEDEAEGPSESMIRLVIANRLLWFSCFARMGTIFSFLGMITWLPKYLVDSATMSSTSAGLLTSVVSGSGLMGAFTGGLLADKILKKRAPSSATALVICGLSLVTLGILGLFPVAYLVLLLIIFGFFNAASEPAALGIIAELRLNQKSYSTAAGLSNSIAHVGGIIAPYAFGLILDVSSSYQLGWIMLGLAPIISSLFMISLARRGF